MVWWFNTKLSLLIGTNGHNGGKHSNTHSNSNASQHACSSLCDEIVVLWRLAALNPGMWKCKNCFQKKKKKLTNFLLFDM